VRLGELSMKLKDYQGAVSYFRRAAAEPAADASILVRLANAQWRAGELDAARGTLQRALERAPADPQALLLKRRFGSPSS
jgi:Flp pilus assembly protein TadD